jgi:hypothetical protein
LQVVGFADARLHPAGAAHVAAGPGGEPGFAGVVVEPFGVFEDPAGDERAVRRREQGLRGSMA